jgi:hypothetical protein
MVDITSIWEETDFSICRVENEALQGKIAGKIGRRVQG